MTNQKVMLFTPVRASNDVIDLMLKSHQALQGVDQRVYYNDCENREHLYRHTAAKECRFLDGTPGCLIPGASEYEGHNWTGARVSRIADIRNAAIKHFLQSDCTHLFIVDADVICHPDQVTTLLAASHPIVSAVYWTVFPGTGPGYMPNVWDMHSYGFASVDSILRLRDPGTYEVGGLGACTLIHRSVLAAGVNYSPVPGIGDPIWGEDRWFCIRAAANGYRLWADTHHIPYHVYQESQLGEAQYCYNTLSTDDLVRTYWLTNKWRRQVADLLTPKPATVYDRLAAEGKKPVLYLCTPGENFHGRWLACFNQLQAYCFNRFGVINPMLGYSSDVYETRQCMWDAMQETAKTTHAGTGLPLAPTYILWLDDDNGLSPAQLESMMATLDGDPTIGMVAAWTHIDMGDDGVREPFCSVGAFTEDLQAEKFTEGILASLPCDVVDIHWTGFPAILMRGELLDAAGDLPFLPLFGSQYRHGKSGEDIAFCHNLRSRSPYRIVVDRRLYVPHFKLRADRPRNQDLLALICPSASVPVQQAV